MMTAMTTASTPRVRRAHGVAWKYVTEKARHPYSVLQSEGRSHLSDTDSLFCHVTDNYIMIRIRMGVLGCLLKPELTLRH